MEHREHRVTIDRGVVKEEYIKFLQLHARNVAV
jgi:hypothetical protein